jgi:uncharacterized protein (TIGR02452 family)
MQKDPNRALSQATHSRIIESNRRAFEAGRSLESVTIHQYGPTYHFHGMRAHSHRGCVEIVEESTMSAILRAGEPLTCALVFADPLCPCPEYGDYDGPMTQEKSICLCTLLYHFLERDMARFVCGELTEPGFTDAMTVFASVPIVRDDNFCDVRSAKCASFLCCTPPIDDGEWDEGTLLAILETRIAKILACAHSHGFRTLVLGAFGCGSYSNDPPVVARVFMKLLVDEKHRFSFDRIIFAILGGTDVFGYFSQAYNEALTKEMCTPTEGEVRRITPAQKPVKILACTRYPGVIHITDEPGLDAVKRLKLEGWKRVIYICAGDPLALGRRDQEAHRDSTDCLMIADRMIGVDSAGKPLESPYPVTVLIAAPPEGGKQSLALLRARIEWILDTVIVEEYLSVVVGAFGCEGRGHRPKDVAEAFRSGLFDSEHAHRRGHFENIGFALPVHLHRADFQKVFPDAAQKTILVRPQ